MLKKEVSNDFMKKNNILKNIIKYSVFILLLAITFYIVFKNNNFHDFLNNVKSANLWFIGLAIICMFVYLGCEALNVNLILRNLGDDVTFGNTYKYSLIGFFFSSITPSSTGGQPAQVYFMNKDKIPISHSALALLIELLGFQFATGFLAIIGFIVNYDILVHHLGNLRFLIFFGIGLNIIILLALSAMIFSKKLSLKMVDWFENILKFFHYKKTDKLKEKFTNSIEEYHNCSVYLKENKKILVRVLLTNIVQLFVYHAVPYCIYLSFGLTGHGAFTMILMEAVLYIAVASLPFPGAVGISEGSFMIMFKMFFTEALLGSAMIISRGVSFYLFVLISGVSTLVFMLQNRFREKALLKEEEKTVE